MMRKRVAALVRLSAVLFVSLISSSHTTVAAEPDVDGYELKSPESENTGSKTEAASGGKRSVKETVEQAIPYLERAGEAWIEKRQCVSCHQVPFMLWSLSAANDQGYAINRDRLKKWTAWSTEVRNFVKPAQKSDLDVASTMASQIDTLNALLLGIPDPPDADTDEPPAQTASDTTAWRQVFAEALVKNQQNQGEWKPCGQLPAQKRPLTETTQVTTAWTLLALSSTQTTAEEQQKALATLQNTNPSSTEWWAVNLLLADKHEKMDADALSDSLIEKQQPDGGWGWLTSDSSDAMATGMAIYALSRHDPERNKAAISRAVNFLTCTQSSDGSWKVPGTKKTTRNKPTPTSNYWGTAWAVIGLLESAF